MENAFSLFLPLPPTKAAAWISADADFPLLWVGCFLTHSVRGRGGQKVEAATEQWGPSRRETLWAEARSPWREEWAGGKEWRGACEAWADKNLAFSLLFLVPQCWPLGSPTLCLLTVREPMPSAGPSHRRWHVSCVCSKLAFLPFCKKNKLELDPNKHDRKNNNSCRGLILKTAGLSTPKPALAAWGVDSSGSPSLAMRDGSGILKLRSLHG